MRRMQMILGLAVAGSITFSAAGQMTHDIDVGPGLAFVPEDILINVGDTVRWTWIGGFHNVVSGVDGTPDGAFSSGLATSAVGTIFEVTFDQAFLDANPTPGDAYSYYCEIHVGLGMVGAIRVITCPGDLNGDQTVSLSDLATLLANYGQTSGVDYFDGDMDMDGDVDLSDLAALLGLYGTGC